MDGRNGRKWVGKLRPGKKEIEIRLPASASVDPMLDLQSMSDKLQEPLIKCKSSFVLFSVISWIFPAKEGSTKTHEQTRTKSLLVPSFLEFVAQQWVTTEIRRRTGVPKLNDKLKFIGHLVVGNSVRGSSYPDASGY